MQGNLFKCKYFLNIFPRISLHCKLVPVQFWIRIWSIEMEERFYPPLALIEKVMVIYVQSGCIITLSEIEEFKGAFFFGKIQKWICDLGSIDSSASKKKKKKKKKTQNPKKWLFSRTTQTNKPRVACNLKNKTTKKKLRLICRKPN